MGMALSAYLRR